MRTCVLKLECSDKKCSQVVYKDRVWRSWGTAGPVKRFGLGFAV